MIKRRLGRTGYEVTAIGLGAYQCTGPFHVTTKAQDELMDAALDLGINLIDTAQSYNFGESEGIVGRALYRNPDKKVHICSKVGSLDQYLSRTRGKEAYVDPEEIMRSIKQSLWLLRKDSIDMMLIHEMDWEAWQADYENGRCVALEVLKECKKQGLVKNVGVSSWEQHVLTQFIRSGDVDVVLSPGGMTLLEAPIFEEVIPAAQEHDVGIILGGAFGQNNPMLSRKNRAGLPAMFESEDKQTVTMARKLEKLYDIADELQCDMFELAIRFVLAHEQIHSHVPGAREAAHIISNFASGNKGPLPDAYVRQIYEIQNLGVSTSTHNLIRDQIRNHTENYYN